MAKLSLRDALNTSLTRTKQYIDTELAKKANSSHGTHLTLGTGSGNAFRGDYGNTAYQHSQAAHAPSNAQKNSDITKAEIEAKLTGAITTHTHSYLPLAGGIMTGDVSYKFTGTGGHAIGLTWINNNTNNTKFGGIGAIANAGTGSSLYIGWGSEPWLASNNLQVSSSGIKYKNNKIYHAGDKPTPDDIGAAKASHGTHLTLGTGSGNAYRGDYGNTAYNHSQAAHAPSNAQKNSDITKAEIEAKLTGSISSHNHTSLTGVTSLTFAANADDSSVIQITKESATSYTDFIMSDDAGTDAWRWRFKAWDSSTSAETAAFNLMTLKATSTTKGQLSINGNVTADSFTENGTALADKYAAKSHGTHLTIGTGASNAAAGNHTHNYAGSSSAGGAANSAVKATQDSAGQQINTTYIKGLSVSGKTITYTKGDGTTGTITTQDTNTTYSAATQSAAGLMSAADKKKLDGVATSANNYSHPNSGATAGSYGPSANVSPALGGTFSVPYFTINTAGHVTAASTKTITLPSDITTFTKSLKVTTSWMDVGISGTNLSTGTYAVQVFGDFAGQGNLWTEYFSGIMSWYSGGTNSTDSDEISLHSCGHATNGNELYLRTLRQSTSSNSPVVKLQIATDIAFTAAVSITFKFKKLI